MGSVINSWTARGTDGFLGHGNVPGRWRRRPPAGDVHVLIPMGDWCAAERHQTRENRGAQTAHPPRNAGQIRTPGKMPDVGKLFPLNRGRLMGDPMISAMAVSVTRSLQEADPQIATYWDNLRATAGE